jgi:hypothetical protein
MALQLVLIPYTLWLFNVAMENGPFMDDFPTKTSIYKGFSMAMLNNQRVVYRSHK